MASRRTIIIAGMVAIALLVAAGTSAAAQGETIQECTIDADDIRSLIETYNANVDELPGILQSQLADQRVDLRVEIPSIERRWDVTTDGDARITDWEYGVATDPTVRVETDRATLCEITRADDPQATMKQAYDDGDIEISGVGFWNSVKVGAVNVISTIADFVTGIF